MEFRSRAQVPFAHQARRITGPLQSIGDRRFRQRQANILGIPGTRIEFMAEPLLVASG